MLLSKPVRAPFRDGTSVLVRNMIQALPAGVEVVYFGDPSAPVRPSGDEVVAASSMSYQPSLADKVKMLAQMAMPRLSKLPIHSFFAPNRASASALDVLRRFPRRRRVMQTLPASTGSASVCHLLARLDRVVVTSEWGRKELIEQGLDETAVHCVYPGVELPRDLSASPVAQRTNVLFAGDLDADVGERLTEIGVALADRDGFRLIIATRPKGEGHQQVREQLEQSLAEQIESDQVRILGEVEDMNALFDSAAIQLYLATHAKKKVDIPFVLLEGMARGVPLAIVRAEPVSELLDVAARESQDVGIGLDAKNFADSVTELISLLDDGERLQRQSDAARALCASHFSAAAMARNYRRHYEELS